MAGFPTVPRTRLHLSGSPLILETARALKGLGRRGGRPVSRLRKWFKIRRARNVGPYGSES